MNLSIGARIVLGFALALVLLLTLGIGSFRHSASLRSDMDWVQHTLQVLEQCEQLASKLHEAQSLARGHALSPDPRLQDRFESIATEAAQTLRSLRSLTVDNATQQSHLDELEPLVTQRLAEARALMSSQADDVRLAVARSVRRGFDQAEPLNRALGALDAEERRLLDERRQRSLDTQQSLSNLLLFGTMGVFVLTVLIALALTRIIRVQLQDLLVSAGQLASGNYRERVQVRSRDEIGRLATAFNSMAQEMEDRQRALDLDRWLRDNLARMANLFVGERRLSALAPLVLKELIARMEAQHGLIYVCQGDGTLTLMASYAASDAPATLHSGEGLIGQACASGERVLVHEIPQDYVRIRSGLGDARPRTLLVQPAKLADQVKAVIELASLRPITDLQASYMEQFADSFALVLTTIQAGERTEQLLVESQALAADLKSQSDKLHESELQLKEQQEELRQSNEELEQANEELEQANEEMEERSTLLAEQKTNLERSNREVNDARRALERQSSLLAQTSKYKSEFLANMSHELRTPLNSLLILSKVLADNADGNLTPKQVQHARTVHGSANDLLELINDILDLSKVEAGVVDLDVEEFAFAEFQQFIENTFAPIAENKGLAFVVKVDPSLGQCMCSDLRRVQQVVKNLLSNALKFTREGSVELNIRRANKEWQGAEGLLDKADKVVAFEVRDTGIGIPQESLQRIFEAFQQGEAGTARKYGGTGLGLSISRELAQRLGGLLQVKSKVGEGSTFTLYLPLESSSAQLAYIAGTLASDSESALPLPEYRSPTRAASAAKIEEDANLNVEGDALQPGDMSLLIIEDDANFAQVIAQFAREKGFKVVMSRTAGNGIATAKRVRPSAITLDLRLPDADGRVVLDQLKHDPATRHIPIHVISVDEARDRSLRAGAVSFLQKPVTREALEDALARTVEFVRDPVRKLLVVEDDEAQRDSITALIGEGDVSTTAVSSAQDALREIERQRFDCIVVDLMLPDQSGSELIRAIQKQLGEHSPPVIVYTGKDLSRQEETELRRFSDAIIVKDARSPERLLDETALFLHRVQSKLPESKRRMIEEVQRDDPVLSGRKVLIVDDDVRNIFAITTALESYRMNVVYAESGRGGLDMLDTNPDVAAVLMDVMMPEMDGFETTQRIRSDERFRQLPIIMVTAKAMKGDREKCLAAGASDYITKPVDMDQLRSLLRVWLYR
jgi:CheY-like chemotaxis protein/CHASE3 domain sensor protein